VRGTVHMHRKEHAAAIFDLGRAIQLDDRLAQAYFQRGLAFTLERDYEKALADCTRLLALRPGDVRAYAQRSLVYHFQGNMEQALADYSRALLIDPGYYLNGLNQGLSDEARNLATRQLADLLDGLRPEISPGDSPEEPNFRIVLQPGKDKPKEVLSTSVPQPVGSAAIASVAANSDKTGETSGELAIEETIEDSPETDHRPAATSAPTQRPEPVKPTTGWQSSKPVSCPLCKHFDLPAEVLDDNRVRCAKCQALFVPAKAVPVTASLAARPQPKKSPPRKVDKEDEEGPLHKWKKPVALATACLMILAAFYLVFPKNRQSEAAPLSVYPARGTVYFQGRPAAGATVFLHAAVGKNVNHPTPRATVKADGTFVLGTYASEDGAPSGEYKVTVQLFKPVPDPEKNDGVVPRNELPAKYARSETSGLTVRVREEENILPAIQLIP
jgi:hypothetical protein